MDDASMGSRAGASGRTAGWLPGLTLHAPDVFLYRACDTFSGVLIFPMLVFSPWAFGTTQPWAVWVMNIAGFILGSLLLVKLFIREAKGFPAMRWDGPARRSGSRGSGARRLTRALAALTVLILAYCLLAAVNAAATYHPATRLFEYHNPWHWLPHSFDSHRSWYVFWMYLGLAGAFWSVWDWLLGMSDAEQRAARRAPETGAMVSSHLPDRLRWLLWWICLNGALLGVEGIIQRASGSGKLLFLVQPRVNEMGEAQFGPYSYRSNAAQYFNLVWPLCLGFWWTLQRAGGRHHGGHHLLLASAAIMAACPIDSLSRGGALVSAGLLVLSVGYLLFVNWVAPAGPRPWVNAMLLVAFLAVATGVGTYFGWDLLSQRMEQLPAGYAGREAMFNDARPMAADYPVYGTGPGTFATVFQLYRVSNATYWPEQLHNDWLETRITFGWVGMALVLAALLCVALRWFVRGGIRGGRRLAALGWFALAGCLIHAIYDFPLQVHSILFLFLVLCAILFSLGGRTAARPGAN